MYKLLATRKEGWMDASGEFHDTEEEAVKASVEYLRQQRRKLYYIALLHDNGIREFVFHHPRQLTDENATVPFKLMLDAWRLIDLTDQKVVKSIDGNLHFYQDARIMKLPVRSVEDIESELGKPILFRPTLKERTHDET